MFTLKEKSHKPEESLVIKEHFVCVKFSLKMLVKVNICGLN